MFCPGFSQYDYSIKNIIIYCRLLITIVFLVLFLDIYMYIHIHKEVQTIIDYVYVFIITMDSTIG